MKYLFLVLIAQFLFAAEWPGMSIYNLDGTWKNQSDQKVQLSNLAGKPVITAMVYTSCQHTCPMITKKIQDIRNSLPSRLQKDVTYALISFDPEGDTPAVLAAYKKKHHLDENWILLTSNELEVRKIAAALGVNFKKTTDGGFSHSNIVSLLDKNGVPVEKIESLNQDTKVIIEKLKQFLK